MKSITVPFESDRGLNLMWLKAQLDDEPKIVTITPPSGRGFIQKVSYMGGAPFARRFAFVQKDTRIEIAFKSGRVVLLLVTGRDYGYDNEYPTLREFDCDYEVLPTKMAGLK